MAKQDKTNSYGIWSKVYWRQCWSDERCSWLQPFDQCVFCSVTNDVHLLSECTSVIWVGKMFPRQSPELQKDCSWFSFFYQFCGDQHIQEHVRSSLLNQAEGTCTQCQLEKQADSMTPVSRTGSKMLPRHRTNTTGTDTFTGKCGVKELAPHFFMTWSNVCDNVEWCLKRDSTPLLQGGCCKIQVLMTNPSFVKSLICSMLVAAVNGCAEVGVCPPSPAGVQLCTVHCRPVVNSAIWSCMKYSALQVCGAETWAIPAMCNSSYGTIK